MASTKNPRDLLADSVSPNLLQALEALYPNQIPLEPITTEQLAVLIGQQKVITLIRSLVVKGFGPQ